ncbi:hypothetical protein [Streptomyces sp. SGAir0957]
MTDFAQYDGYKRDFDFCVGPARPDGFRSREFGDRLWADVSGLLGTPFDGATIRPKAHEGCNYWFDNEDLSASAYSVPLEGSVNQAARHAARHRGRTRVSAALARTIAAPPSSALGPLGAVAYRPAAAAGVRRP